MKWLEELMRENMVGVGGKSWLLCLQGVSRMKNRVDPLHNQGHLVRMIKDAVLVVKIEKIKVDWTVLLMAICWHDVWTAKNVPKNFFGFIREYVWDGIGSAIMFGKAAKKVGLEQDIVKKVKRAIRKHPSIHLGKHNTQEEKVLWDVDNLETWSWERVKSLEKELFNKKRDKQKNRQIRLAKFYFNHFMKGRNGKNLYFDWSRMEFMERKGIYMKRSRKLMKKYGESFV